MSDASWYHHREAQNHSPEHSRSPFMAGGMIPPPIRNAGSLSIFKQQLKTHLFQLYLTTYKYMADMLTEYKPNRPLRSLGSSQLEIPRVHTKQGESAFSYYAARSWNQLPEEIRCAKTLATFKSRLKTHLFSCAFVE